MSDDAHAELEARLILERRSRAFHVELDKSNPGQAPAPRNLIGVALSGGGIRSALYNDGFLQGLSHRGFLRYVDYLSSVSGGGYIAAHLLAQQEPPPTAEAANQSFASSQPKSAVDEPSFHDDNYGHIDPLTADHSPTWHLGHNPQTGKINRLRLAGIGGYLSHPMILAPAYLWAIIFSVAFYLGVAGVISTLAAMLWRSFDDPTFRSLYRIALWIRTGDELLIAFIPFILFLILYVAMEVCVTGIRMFIGFELRGPQLLHSRIRTSMLVILLLAFLASIGVFLGNGTTKLNAGETDSIQLNQYAQWLVGLAILMQFLVYVGTDQLFKSERQEAKNWQKHLQRFISVAVVLLLIFALVHWIGRDNISGFTTHREPTLVVGDVENWDTLAQIMEDSPLTTKRQVKTGDDLFNSLDYTLKLPKFLVPDSTWHQIIAGRRFDVLRTDQENKTPPSDDDEVPSDAWQAERRILGAAYAFWLTSIRGCRQLSDYPGDQKAETEKLENLGTIEYINSKNTPVNSVNSFVSSTNEVVLACWLVLKVTEQHQQELLKRWNMRLSSPEFTCDLLHISSKEQKNQDYFLNSSQAFDMISRLQKYWDAAKPSLGESTRQSIIGAINRLPSLKKVDNQRMLETAAVKGEYAKVNRMLLEQLYPGAVRAKDIPSTFVVASHDQRARQSWLGFFVLLSLLGTVSSVFRYRLSALFRFYRNQIGQNFLRSVRHPRRTIARCPLYALNPTTVGLPFPIWQAASLEPTTINGSYQVRNRPFILTPGICGNEDELGNRITCQQLSLKRTDSEAAITIADAVTLSGAAVSPLMTNNRALSLLVDLLNTGLGTQIYRFDGGGKSRSEQSSIGWLWAIFGAVAFGWLLFWITSDLVLTALGIVLVVVIGICLIYELGTPHFLHLLFAPREVHRGHDDSVRRRSFYVADGGFCDYLGVSSLLRRRCKLIVVSDAGANAGNDHLGTLSSMCEHAQSELGVRFLDLDHEAPIDFGRLQQDEKRLVHQPYLCMRVRYPNDAEGLLVYCQMAITENDPIEIRQIRNKFPSFPDEPTTNQFYTDDQVSAYRALGYHIASNVCRELERWDFAQPTPQTNATMPPGSTTGTSTAGTTTSGTTSQNIVPQSSGAQATAVSLSSDVVPLPPAVSAAHATKGEQGRSPIEHFKRALDGQAQFHATACSANVPYFQVVRERLLTAYRLACHEEVSYRRDDVYSEAIWPQSSFAFPSFHQHAERVFGRGSHGIEPHCAAHWLLTYETSGDVRSAYRTAILADINTLDVKVESFCAVLFEALISRYQQPTPSDRILVMTAHLIAMAVACQEVHRGRPHATFQIGGRDKLLLLCKPIADALVNLGEDDSCLPQSTNKIIAEITELQQALFHGGEHVTVVSFAQTLSLMWGRITRRDKADSEVEHVRKRAEELFDDIAKNVSGESLIIEARRDLNKGLAKTNLNKVQQALMRLWYIGFLRKDPRDGRPVSVFESGKLTRALATVRFEPGGTTSKNWLQVLIVQPSLRAAYINAVVADRNINVPDMNCSLQYLLTDLQDKLEDANRQEPAARLITAHTAAIVAAVMASDSGLQLENLSAESAVAIRRLCWSVASALPTSFPASRIQQQATQLVNRLLEALTKNQTALQAAKWTPFRSATLMKCLVSMAARLLRDGASTETLWAGLIDVEQIRRLFPLDDTGALTNAGLTLASAEVLASYIEQNQQADLKSGLLKIWYGNLLTTDIIRQILSTPPGSKSRNPRRRS